MLLFKQRYSVIIYEVLRRFKNYFLLNIEFWISTCFCQFVNVVLCNFILGVRIHVTLAWYKIENGM